MGLILPQTVKVRTNGSNCKYFREKGYEFEKCGDFIEVDVLDLKKGSTVNVKYKCDICGKEAETWYSTVVKYNKKNELITCGSKSCINKKREDTCMKKYGVKSTNQLKTVKDKRINTCMKKYGENITNPFQAESVKNKIKATNLERYGCEYSLQSEEVKKKTKKTLKEKYGKDIVNISQVKEIQDKIKETCKEKYGVENVSQNKAIRNKAKATNLERYGCEHSFQSEKIKKKIRKTWQEKYGKNVVNVSQVKEIQDKIKVTCKERYGTDCPAKSSIIQNKIRATNLERYGNECALQSEKIKKKANETMMEKYGTEHPFQVKEIKNKALDSFQFHGTGPCSRAQKYIHFLIGGTLNKHVCNSLVDICFKEEKIAIEYDGSGHFLTDKFNGNKTPSKEALLKEKEREDKIINNGYKMIRFIATKDRIPSDEVILNLIEEFKNSDFKVIRINFEEGTIEKDYNEKLCYDFGELRKITKKDLEQFESKKQ